MKGEAIAIIPARFASTRLPGKPLLPLGGIPMIVHVARRAELARHVSRVIVATDDRRIAEAVANNGGTAVMTSPTARSGADRVAEVARSCAAEIIVNVQGDEPLIEPSTIDAAIEPMLEDPSLQISTTSEPIDSIEDVLNPNVVKVVTGLDGFAIYFSRSPVPYPRSGGSQSVEDALRSDPAMLSRYRKHSGLYVYRRAFLEAFSRMECTPLESIEALEQLRVLEHGYRIKVVEVSDRSIGVDTEQDYLRVRKLIEEKTR